jgi:hypothetical protein
MAINIDEILEKLRVAKTAIKEIEYLLGDSGKRERKLKLLRSFTEIREKQNLDGQQYNCLYNALYHGFMENEITHGIMEIEPKNLLKIVRYYFKHPTSGDLNLMGNETKERWIQKTTWSRMEAFACDVEEMLVLCCYFYMKHDIILVIHIYQDYTDRITSVRLPRRAEHSRPMTEVNLSVFHTDDRGSDGYDHYNALIRKTNRENAN